MEADVTVIGSGPAWLTAALHAHKSGVKKVLLIEREEGARRNFEAVYTQWLRSGAI